ncbi:MAG: hypothetical protein ACOCNU_01725, partial [Bacteroidales bacterium]
PPLAVKPFEHKKHRRIAHVLCNAPIFIRTAVTIICLDRSIISGIVFTVSEIFFIFSKMFFTIL